MKPIINSVLCSVVVTALGISTSTTAYANGYAPSNVHESIWNGQFAPDSPETVAMMRYGDDRPDFYNGQLNMSVPIYTWKDNLFEIPISLGYSYSGLKPGFTYSSVGLGWFLNAGGTITREVRGIPDETYDMAFSAADCLLASYKEGLDDPTYGDNMDRFLGTGNPYNGCSMRGFVTMYNNSFDTSVLSSGSPMFMYTGSLVNEFALGMKLNDGPLCHCVETEPDIFHFSFLGYKGSFILQPGGKVLILDSDTPAGELDIVFHCPSVNGGNDSYFIITMGDMVQYKFAARTYSKSTEIINGSDSGGESDTWTSWKLSEILHPSGHRVLFQYEDNIVSNYSAAKSRDHLTVDDGGSTGSGYRSVNNWQRPESYSESTLSMVTVYDKRLEKIVIENRGAISFNYDDGLLSSVIVNTDFGFEYNKFRTVSMSYYTPYSADSFTQRCISINFLKSVTFSDLGTYSFNYDCADDQHRFPDSTDLSSLYRTDWYGYYNSTSYASAYSNSSLGIQQLAEHVFTARHSYDLACARMGAMIRVSYPTGGYTTFEYEANEYRRIAGISSHEDGNDHGAAGIRVSKISTFESDGTQVRERRLSYLLENGASSGVLLQPVTMEDIYFAYEFENRYSPLKLRVRREACSPLLDLGYTKDYHIEYLRVVEEVRETSSGPLVAKTEHKFHSSSPAIENTGHNCEELSQSSRFSSEMQGIFSISRTTGPILDWRMKGSLVCGGRERYSRECAVSSTDSSLETVSEYLYHTLPSSVSGVQSSYQGITMLGGCIYVREYYQNLPYLSSVSTIRSEDDGSRFTKRVTFDVNTLGRTSLVCEDVSDGGLLTTEYSYHSVSPALITSVTARRGDRLVSKREMNYYPISDSHCDCLVPFQLIEYAVDASGAVSGDRVTASFGSYDGWCNPGTVTDASGRTVTWSWGYSGLHPLSMSVSENNRTRTTSWEWIPTVGITKVTNPEGRETSYDYDDNGRLIHVFDAMGNQVRECYYNTVTTMDMNLAPLTVSRNFIVNHIHRGYGFTASDVQYYDGLGRPEQSISVTPGNPCTVTCWRHDALDRLDAQSLPFGDSGNGAYVFGWPAALEARYVDFDEEGESLWNRTVYEGGESGRELTHTLPGTDFAAHPSQKRYYGNGPDDVIIYEYDPDGNSICRMGHYPAESLRGEESIDGDGRRSVSWMDREDRLVCSTRYGYDGVQADTYYVYDDNGHIVWVLSPEASSYIGEGVLESTDVIARDYCYSYQYDKWGRMTCRRLPGKEAEYFVYDSADRIVMRSDGELRKNKEWIFDWYNAFDELVQSCIVTQDRAAARLQEYFPASGAPLANRNSFGRKLMLSQSDYGPSNSDSVSSGLAGAIAFAPEPGVVSASDLGSVRNLKTREVLAVVPAKKNIEYKKYNYPRCVIDPLTGECITIYGGWDTTYTNTAVTRFFYYDKMGRVAQIAERNALGGISRTSYKYDWNGNILASVERHTTSEDEESEEDVKRSEFQYDARGRLVYENVRVNGGEYASMEHEYNDIGQSAGSLLGDPEYGISRENAYTLQGWLKSSEYRNYVGELMFSEELSYASPSFGTPQYGGNISQILTRHCGHNANEEAFTYDALGRLLGSKRNAASEEGQRRFTEQGLSYDLNGNILTLARYGADGNNPGDRFTFTYNGNCISEITDDAAEVYPYEYDANGNMCKDGLRGLTITYNFLNLPATVKEFDMVKASYAYCSDGTKFKVTDSRGTSLVYLGSMVYVLDDNDCVFESTGFSEGRVVAGITETVPRYHLTDHLGSVRCVTLGVEGDDTPIYEQNDYYAFGMRMDSVSANGDALSSVDDDNGTGIGSIAVQNGNVVRRWRFSGKEEQPMMGAHLQDFDARFYDSRIARWTTADPLAERYYNVTPFSYCHNNPIVYFDPDGRADFVVRRKIIGNDGNDDGRLYVLKTSSRRFYNETDIVSGAGLSGKERRYALKFIKDNSGSTDSFKKNASIYDSFVEINGSSDVRQAMINEVMRDDGRGGKDASNNREYGGIIKKGTVVPEPPGPVSDPSKGGASIRLTVGYSSFHSHPSGDNDTHTYSQPPSQADIDGSGNDIHYVFGRRNGLVYIFSGQCVEAVVPMSTFVSPIIKTRSK